MTLKQKREIVTWFIDDSTTSMNTLDYIRCINGYLENKVGYDTARLKLLDVLRDYLNKKFTLAAKKRGKR